MYIKLVLSPFLVMLFLLTGTTHACGPSDDHCVPDTYNQPSPDSGSDLAPKTSPRPQPRPDTVTNTNTNSDTSSGGSSDSGLSNGGLGDGTGAVGSTDNDGGGSSPDPSQPTGGAYVVQTVAKTTQILGGAIKNAADTMIGKAIGDVTQVLTNQATLREVITSRTSEEIYTKLPASDSWDSYIADNTQNNNNPPTQPESDDSDFYDYYRQDGPSADAGAGSGGGQVTLEWNPGTGSLNDVLRASGEEYQDDPRITNPDYTKGGSGDSVPETTSRPETDPTTLEDETSEEPSTDTTPAPASPPVADPVPTPSSPATTPALTSPNGSIEPPYISPSGMGSFGGDELGGIRVNCSGGGSCSATQAQIEAAKALKSQCGSSCPTITINPGTDTISGGDSLRSRDNLVYNEDGTVARDENGVAIYEFEANGKTYTANSDSSGWDVEGLTPPPPVRVSTMNGGGGSGSGVVTETVTTVDPEALAAAQAKVAAAQETLAFELAYSETPESIAAARNTLALALDEQAQIERGVTQVVTRQVSTEKGKDIYSMQPEGIPTESIDAAQNTLENTRDNLRSDWETVRDESRDYTPPSSYDYYTQGGPSGDAGAGGGTLPTADDRVAITPGPGSPGFESPVPEDSPGVVKRVEEVVQNATDILLSTTANNQILPSYIRSAAQETLVNRAQSRITDAITAQAEAVQNLEAVIADYEYEVANGSVLDQIAAEQRIAAAQEVEAAATANVDRTIAAANKLISKTRANDTLAAELIAQDTMDVLNKTANTEENESFLAKLSDIVTGKAPISSIMPGGDSEADPSYNRTISAAEITGISSDGTITIARVDPNTNKLIPGSTIVGLEEGIAFKLGENTYIIENIDTQNQKVTLTSGDQSFTVDQNGQIDDSELTTPTAPQFGDLDITLDDVISIAPGDEDNPIIIRTPAEEAQRKAEQDELLAQVQGDGSDPETSSDYYGPGSGGPSAMPGGALAINEQSENATEVAEQNLREAEAALAAAKAVGGDERAIAKAEEAVAELQGILDNVAEGGRYTYEAAAAADEASRLAIGASEAAIEVASTPTTNNKEDLARERELMDRLLADGRLDSNDYAELTKYVEENGPVVSARIENMVRIETGEGTFAVLPDYISVGGYRLAGGELDLKNFVEANGLRLPTQTEEDILYQNATDIGAIDGTGPTGYIPSNEITDGACVGSDCEIRAGYMKSVINYPGDRHGEGTAIYLGIYPEGYEKEGQYVQGNPQDIHDSTYGGDRTQGAKGIIAIDENQPTNTLSDEELENLIAEKTAAVVTDITGAAITSRSVATPYTTREDTGDIEVVSYGPEEKTTIAPKPRRDLAYLGYGLTLTPDERYHRIGSELAALEVLNKQIGEAIANDLSGSALERLKAEREDLVAVIKEKETLSEKETWVVTTTEPKKRAEVLEQLGLTEEKYRNNRETVLGLRSEAETAVREAQAAAMVLTGNIPKSIKDADPSFSADLDSMSDTEINRLIDRVATELPSATETLYPENPIVVVNTKDDSPIPNRFDVLRNNVVGWLGDVADTVVPVQTRVADLAEEDCGGMSCEERFLRMSKAEVPGNFDDLLIFFLSGVARKQGNEITPGLPFSATWEETLRWVTESYGYYEFSNKAEKNFNSLVMGSDDAELRARALEMALNPSTIPKEFFEKYDLDPNDLPTDNWGAYDPRYDDSDWRYGPKERDDWKSISGTYWVTKTWRKPVSVDDLANSGLDTVVAGATNLITSAIKGIASTFGLEEQFANQDVLVQTVEKKQEIDRTLDAAEQKIANAENYDPYYVNVARQNLREAERARAELNTVDPTDSKAVAAAAEEVADVAARANILNALDTITQRERDLAALEDKAMRMHEPADLVAEHDELRGIVETTGRAVGASAASIELAEQMTRVDLRAFLALDGDENGNIDSARADAMKDSLEALERAKQHELDAIIASANNDPNLAVASQGWADEWVNGALTRSRQSVGSDIANRLTAPMNGTLHPEYFSPGSSDFGPRDRNGDGNPYNDAPHKAQDIYPPTVEALLDYDSTRVVPMMTGVILDIRRESYPTTGTWGEFAVVAYDVNGDGVVDEREKSCTGSNTLCQRASHLSVNPELAVGDSVTTNTTLGHAIGTGTYFGMHQAEYSRQHPEATEEEVYEAVVRRFIDSNGRWNNSGVTPPHVDLGTIGAGFVAYDPHNVYEIENSNRVYQIGETIETTLNISGVSGGSTQLDSIRANTEHTPDVLAAIAAVEAREILPDNSAIRDEMETNAEEAISLMNRVHNVQNNGNEELGVKSERDEQEISELTTQAQALADRNAELLAQAEREANPIEQINPGGGSGSGGGQTILDRIVDAFTGGGGSGDSDRNTGFGFGDTDGDNDGNNRTPDNVVTAEVDVGDEVVELPIVFPTTFDDVVADTLLDDIFGDEVLVGEAGEDTLTGSAGGDTLAGDSVWDGYLTGSPVFTYNVQNDTGDETYIAAGLTDPERGASYSELGKELGYTDSFDTIASRANDFEVIQAALGGYGQDDIDSVSYVEEPSGSRYAGTLNYTVRLKNGEEVTFRTSEVMTADALRRAVYETGYLEGNDPIWLLGQADYRGTVAVPEEVRYREEPTERENYLKRKWREFTEFFGSQSEETESDEVYTNFNAV